MPGTASPSCRRPWPICVEEPSARWSCRCAMPARLRHDAPRWVRSVAALADEGCTPCRSTWLDQHDTFSCPRRSTLTMETYDIIIIGSGHNALITAAYVTRAGHTVLVLEKNDRPGGYLRTDEVTVPGFKHDVYAAAHPLFLTGPAYADLSTRTKIFLCVTILSKFVNSQLSHCTTLI